MRINKMEVFVVLEGDIWMSANSMFIRGVFTDKKKAISSIIDDINKISKKTKVDTIWKFYPDECLLTDEEVEDLWTEIEHYCYNSLNEQNQIREFDRSYQIQAYDTDTMT